MIKRRDNIIQSALQLFAKNGYNGTSTSQISQEAKVSEGLIFKHFQNKKGLLNAIYKMADVKVVEFLEKIEKIEANTEIIQRVMEFPFQLEEEDYPLWQLIFGLQWQSGLANPETIDPLKNQLEKAFKALKYSNPALETELIISYMNGFAATLLLNPRRIEKEVILASLQKKYKWILK